MPNDLFTSDFIASLSPLLSSMDFCIRLSRDAIVSGSVLLVGTGPNPFLASKKRPLLMIWNSLLFDRRAVVDVRNIWRRYKINKTIVIARIFVKFSELVCLELILIK